MITSIQKTSEYDYEMYNSFPRGVHRRHFESKEAEAKFWDSLTRHEKLDIPKRSMTLDTDFTFTRRIKYVWNTAVDGTVAKEPKVMVEIKFEEEELIMERIFRSDIYKTVTNTKWIPSEAFSFDFSDEVKEEIYTCE